MKKKKLFSFVEVDENTPIQKLGVLDQLRVVVKKMSHDDAEELRADDVVTQNILHMKADLLGFINKALQPIREGRAYAVTVSIPNTFDPVFDEVFESSAIANFYKVVIHRPDIEYDIKYDIIVDLELKK